jgi:hypothetical protein
MLSFSGFDPKRTSLARMHIAAQMWWARTLRRNRFHSDALITQSGGDD